MMHDYKLRHDLAFILRVKLILLKTLVIFVGYFIFSRKGKYIERSDYYYNVKQVEACTQRIAQKTVKKY